MLIADFLNSNLLNGLFCKCIHCYSCRFSIQGTWVEMAYSELMRKVLIKLAICSIAFINGEIVLFAAETTMVVISCCYGWHGGSSCFNTLLCTPCVHSSTAIFFMRYSWHAPWCACNACLGKYLAEDLCQYWMQLCLQFSPGDIDLAKLQKHILSFQAFNLF